MKTLIHSGALTVLLTVLGLSAFAQGTAFTYQGRLNDGSSPANGAYDLAFALFDAASGGTQQGGALTNAATAVSNGLFTVTLDFGNQFAGPARWLQIGVATNGNGAFATLSPRQALTAVPYAVRSISAATVDSGGQNALALTSGGSTALLLSPIATNGTVNFLAGAATNSITSDSVGVTISGGGATTYFIQDGTNAPMNIAGPNTSGGDFSTIGGGMRNTIGTDAHAAVIAGGIGNSLGSNSVAAFIGGGFQVTIGTNAGNTVLAGGDNNTIGANARSASLVGGERNEIGASSTYGFIGGGWNNRTGTNALGAAIASGINNRVGTNALVAFIGGGYQNTIEDGNVDSTITAGDNNTIRTNSSWGSIGGGERNEIAGGARWATVPGGSRNQVAGDYGFAAGRQAKASHPGAFVWADSQGTDFASTANDQVSFRAQGGVRFTSGSGSPNQTVAWTPGSASWSFTSDRNTKDRIAPVNPQSVLEKLTHVPIAEWSYIGFEQRHVGPMAQDFHAQFPLNPNDKVLNDADLHGVALAAIQGLNAKVESGKQKIETLETENAELKARNESLEARLNRLEKLVSERK
ncbi:MAG: hypothetical protein U1F65_09875 [Verrucomicrobiota bacterium]